MIRELVRMSDFYDAISQGEGYIVITDKPTARQIAHPPYCASLQSEHFQEKVVRKQATKRVLLPGLDDERGTRSVRRHSLLLRVSQPGQQRQAVHRPYGRRRPG